MHAGRNNQETSRYFDNADTAILCFVGLWGTCFCVGGALFLVVVLDH